MRPRFALARVRRKGGLFCPFCGRLPARDGRSEPQGRGRAGRTVRAARRRCGRHREGRPSAAQGNVRDGSRGGAGARRLRPRGISGKQKRPLPAAALRLGSPLCMAEKGAGRLAAVWQDTTAGGRRKNFFCAPPCALSPRRRTRPRSFLRKGRGLAFFRPPPSPASPRRSGRQRSLVCSAPPLSEKSLLRKSFSNGYEGVTTLLRPCGAPFPFNGGRLGRAPPSQTFSRSGRATLALPFQFFPQKRVPENRRAQLEISGKRRRRRASRAF